MTKAIGFTNPDEIHQDRRDRFSNDLKNPAQLPMMASEIKLRTLSIKKNSLIIGRILTEASEILPHGEYINWAKKECAFSKTTIYNLRKLYTTCGGYPKIVEKINTSVLYKISSPKFPKELKEYILKNADILDKISNETIKDISERFVKKELTLKSPEVINLLQYNRDQDAVEYYHIEIKRRIELLTKIHKQFSDNVQKLEWPNFPNKSKTVLNRPQIRKINKLIDEIKNMVDKLKPKAISLKK